MFKTFLTSHPRRLLERARHGFYHGLMEDVLNDESENISLSQLLDLPHTTAALNMKRVGAKPKEFLKLKCLTT